jgi:hypothetical protein
MMKGGTSTQGTDLHSESHYSASQTAYGGGGGFNVGLYSASADFEHSDTQANSSVQMKNVEVAFNYAIVDIDRQ